VTKEKVGHSGLPTAPPPNELRRRVPSFSLPSIPRFFNEVSIAIRPTHDNENRKRADSEPEA
jgi:hypothetical protein